MKPRTATDRRDDEDDGSDPAPPRQAGTQRGRPPADLRPSHGDVIRLCLCVDDVGLHSGIDEAALQLVALRRVHAFGCMVGGRSWARSRRALRGVDRSHVDIGLHLDLTERPLALRAPWRLPLLIAATQTRLADRRPLQREIRAQLNAFEDALSHAPDFIDGHQHVHQFPVVRSMLLEELDRRYGAKLPWLRSSRPVRGGAVPQFKSRVIEWLGAAALARLAQHRGYRQNARLLGVYDFSGGASRYAELMAQWLDEAQDGDLLMCHPGLYHAQADALAPSRPAEYAVLAGDRFGQQLSQGRIRLQAMSRILRGVAPGR